MTRVPPTIKPASKGPTQRSSSPQAPARPRATQKPQMTGAQKAQQIKDDEVPELKEGAQGAGEGQGGPDWTLTGEHAAIASNEEVQNREDRLQSHERQAEEERKEDGKQIHKSLKTVQQKSGDQKAGAQAKAKAAGQHKSDGFEAAGSFETSPSGIHAKLKLQETQRAKAAALHQTAPRTTGNLGDAMKALHNAKDHGVFFKENEAGQGRPDEEMEDPELAAAVEECIRQLFGVRGILRVGPGENEVGEPVVLVVAARGFTAQSMAQVPQTVHRFKTLLALPFELLPLRRERL